MATKEEHALARRLFHVRCIAASGKTFQDLFWAVMQAKHGSTFEAVGPQGRKGDGGNDGFLPAEGHFYQLYAPLNPREKVDVAAKKLRDDFNKVKVNWGGASGSDLRKYTFVYNEKYEGMPKEICLELQSLRASHNGIVFAPYGAKHLESDFMNLSVADWDGILGGAVPDPGRVVGLDYTELAEVIRYLLSSEVEESESRIDLPPELNEKIRLNDLSTENAIHIQSGALLTGRIETYFQANSNFALSELRAHVVGLYEAAKMAVAAERSSESGAEIDAVFKVFRRSLFPKNRTVATINAVNAVIGYFFEACDVFDPRPESKGKPGAAP